LEKCLDLPRSGAAERFDATGTGVLRDSSFAGFMAVRDEVLAAGLAPLPEPFLDTTFAVFAFNRIDLEVDALRLAAFFTDLDFALAFIAIGPATYTGYAS
jgi:hypothetical protein